MVPERKKAVVLATLLLSTLDYYENFSNRPVYWHNLLEEEVEFQNEILRQLKKSTFFSTLIYQKRYAGVTFEEV